MKRERSLGRQPTNYRAQKNKNISIKKIRPQVSLTEFYLETTLHRKLKFASTNLFLVYWVQTTGQFTLI